MRKLTAVGPGLPSLRSVLSALALAVAGGGEPAAPTPPDAAPATYRLSGKAHVTAAPLLDRDVEVHADAVVSPGAAPGLLTVRVAAEGQACALGARAGAAGALAFEPGQRCPLDLRGPDARGHVDVRLREGRGRLAEGRLALDLDVDLDGAVSVRTARQVEVLGQPVEVPAVWMPEVAIQGRAQASAEGPQDHARAAEAATGPAAGGSPGP